MWSETSAQAPEAADYKREGDWMEVVLRRAGVELQRPYDIREECSVSTTQSVFVEFCGQSWVLEQASIGLRPGRKLMPKHPNHRFSTGSQHKRLCFYSELHSHYRDHMIFADRVVYRHSLFLLSSVGRAGCLSRRVLDCAPVGNQGPSTPSFAFQLGRSLEGCGSTASSSRIAETT